MLLDTAVFFNTQTILNFNLEKIVYFNYLHFNFTREGMNVNLRLFCFLQFYILLSLRFWKFHIENSKLTLFCFETMYEILLASYWLEELMEFQSKTYHKPNNTWICIPIWSCNIQRKSKSNNIICWVFWIQIKFQHNICSFLWKQNEYYRQLPPFCEHQYAFFCCFKFHTSPRMKPKSHSRLFLPESHMHVDQIVFLKKPNKMCNLNFQIFATVLGLLRWQNFQENYPFPEKRLRRTKFLMCFLKSYG